VRVVIRWTSIIWFLALHLVVLITNKLYIWMLFAVAVVPGQVLKCIYILTWIINPKNSIQILIPPSAVQEIRSWQYVVFNIFLHI
jgi:hypothetical protein